MLGVTSFAATTNNALSAIRLGSIQTSAFMKIDADSNKLSGGRVRGLKGLFLS